MTTKTIKWVIILNFIVASLFIIASLLVDRYFAWVLTSISLCCLLAITCMCLWDTNKSRLARTVSFLDDNLTFFGQCRTPADVTTYCITSIDVGKEKKFLLIVDKHRYLVKSVQDAEEILETYGDIVRV